MNLLKKGVDLIMFGLMLFLLSYPVARGLWRHGVLGCILLFLFGCHHLLNLRWYKGICKGKWPMGRIFGAVIDGSLLLAACATLLSCALMAGDVFAFMPFAMPWWARGLHVAATAWLFVLIAWHTGVHWRGLCHAGARLCGKYWNVAAPGLCVVGVYCFVQSGIWRNMLLLDAPRPQTVAQFLAEYLGSALLFYLIPNLARGRAKSMGEAGANTK